MVQARVSPHTFAEMEYVLESVPTDTVEAWETP